MKQVHTECNEPLPLVQPNGWGIPQESEKFRFKFSQIDDETESSFSADYCIKVQISPQFFVCFRRKGKQLLGSLIPSMDIRHIQNCLLN